MQTEQIRCESCYRQLTDKEGNAVQSFLLLAKGGSTVYVCVDCCQEGKHKYLENEGFTQAGYKIAGK